MIENSLWTHWWGDADLLIRSVFILLALMSVTGWGVIIYKLIQFRGVLRNELALRQQLILDRPPPEVSPGALTPLFYRTASKMVWGVDGEINKLKLDNKADQFLDEQRIELENGLILLAIIGNSAPFIGLLGTVWGIMHALQSLGGSAMLTMDMVAGPVSEALVATAVGLFAAIPAAAAYNLLVRWLRRISSVMAGNLRELADRILLDGGR